VKNRVPVPINAALLACGDLDQRAEMCVEKMAKLAHPNAGPAQNPTAGMTLEDASKAAGEVPFMTSSRSKVCLYAPISEPRAENQNTDQCKVVLFKPHMLLFKV